MGKSGLDALEARLKDQFFKNDKIWWGLTWVYFGYVVLGGVSWKVHKHVYTGDENKSIVENIKKGQIATFRKRVYAEFFFPSFLRYHITYRFHVLMAGVWLITGVYNLRNQPKFIGVNDGKKLFENRRLHAGLSGYMYAISSILKGATASMMSWYSHSLGFARWPMITYGIYDVVSLLLAIKFILQGNIPDHKRWMVRNFAMGSGSIWVRVMGAIWAAYDLEFMKDNEFYRKMNNVILCGGFTMGPLFGEFWLAKTRQRRDAALAAMVGLSVAVLVAGKAIYEEKKDYDANQYSRAKNRSFAT
uniref:Uncharacterized protein n=1 Tax=Mucochytrium quahogii TaxID=96639 RepID=A0A7S2SK06_9STRA|mmetsp:Transcript_7605/g.12304  ORF Transcript_7605/g.12304 Transcript_7605/m.12304 type:complete len:303 (+) Transcript_7605:82-990(+)